MILGTDFMEKTHRVRMQKRIKKQTEEIKLLKELRKQDEVWSQTLEMQLWKEWAEDYPNVTSHYPVERLVGVIRELCRQLDEERKCFRRVVCK